MRHGKKINHLGRQTAHRNAMLSNMANSLVEHKRISTTVAKAKALKRFVEPLITKSKEDTTHNRRVVFSYLKNKEAVSELFRDVAVKVADRPGGYTRIIRTGNRLGDNAEMCIIELVDYNELYNNDKPEKKKRTRRAGKKVEASTPAPAAEEVAEAPAKEEAPAAEAPAETPAEADNAQAPEATADTEDSSDSSEASDDTKEKE